MAKKSRGLGFSRRSFIKTMGASGAALAAPPVFAPAVHAAKGLKLGYVSPQTGPLAAFAEPPCTMTSMEGVENSCPPALTWMEGMVKRPGDLGTKT